jgi:peptidoglycan/xylan/chitin deacetylase (PgdA/CDA1 family)
MNRRQFLVSSLASLASLTSQAQEKVKIYLTIDDGPSPSMESILNTLGTSNPATFYLVGRNLKSEFDSVFARLAIMNGHLLGNHSYSHPSFSKISVDEAREEIEKTDELLEKIYSDVGMPRPAKFFRFPYGDDGFCKIKGVQHGSLEKQYFIAKFLHDQGYQTQFWDVDSCDWRYYSKSAPLSQETILRNCQQAQNGDIVLVHDRPFTARTLIPFLVNSGKFELVLPI